MFTLLQTCVLVGLDWAEPMMLLLLHITCSCIFMHTYLNSLYSYILNCIGTFLIVSFSFSLSFFWLVVSWHLNENLLHPRTLFISGIPLPLTPFPLTSGSMMRRPNRTSLRTSLDEAFIRNAKSFCRTSPTLTYPLSSIVKVRSHCVMSRSLVCPC